MKTMNAISAGTAMAVLAAMTTAAPALAQEAAQRIEVGPAPDWVDPSEPLAVPDDADGAAFVRLNETIVHLGEGGSQTYTSQWFKLLHPQALQAGNLAVQWNPAAGPATVHRVNVHRDGEVIDVLERAEFDVLRREEQLEKAMLDGTLTATMRVPDLRVGDELEMAFTVASHDPTLGNKDGGILFLADAPPPGRFRLALGWEEGHEPQIRATDDFGVEPQRREGRYEIRADNPDLLVPPKEAPLRFALTRILEYSDFADWRDVSRTMHPYYVSASKVEEGSAVAALADEIMADHDTDMARAAAALDLVQREVRYIYVGLTGGNLTPADAGETWERRYGDCKGKTALLLALLSRMGIAAEAVLASNSGYDRALETRLPLVGAFDHVLVRADIGGETYWMDGTLPDVAGPSRQPAIDYRRVLPLSASGEMLETIAFTPSALPLEMGIVSFDASVGFDAPAKKHQVMVTRGPKAYGQYVALSALTNQQILRSFRGEMAGSSDWDTIDAVDYRFDEATQAGIITIEGTGPINWDEEGSSHSLTLPGGGFYPPDRHVRDAGRYADAPFAVKRVYSCHVTTVTLPEDTDLSDWGHNSQIDRELFGRAYYRQIQRSEDGRIRMIRGSRSQVEELAADTAMRHNELLDNFDNSMAIIHYDPDPDITNWTTGKPVPSLQEIDWTGADVPCLPEDYLAD